MPDEVLFLGEDASRVASSIAVHLEPSQQLGAVLILAAIAITLLIFAADMLAPEQGPRR